MTRYVLSFSGILIAMIAYMFFLDYRDQQMFDSYNRCLTEGCRKWLLFFFGGLCWVFQFHWLLLVSFLLDLIMMTTEQKLEKAFQNIEELSTILENNEYEQFFVSHLIPIKFELQRQLTNLKYHSKIKE